MFHEFRWQIDCKRSWFQSAACSISFFQINIVASLQKQTRPLFTSAAFKFIDTVSVSCDSKKWNKPWMVSTAEKKQLSKRESTLFIYFAIAWCTFCNNVLSICSFSASAVEKNEYWNWRRQHFVYFPCQIRWKHVLKVLITVDSIQFWIIYVSEKSIKMISLHRIHRSMTWSFYDGAVSSI